MTCADARQLLSRRLDAALAPAEERALETHLQGCRACRAVVRELEMERSLLRQEWQPVAAPAGFATRVAAALPPRAAPRASPLLRRPLPALAMALALLFVVALAVPPARAGLGLLLRTVVLRETSDPPPERRISPGAVLTLEEAQRQVPWRVRTPANLPEGYRLVAVTVGEVHSFAVGPTVVLHYQQGDGARAPALRIVELRVAGRPEEPVEPGAATRVRVGEQDALLIDGEWQTRDGRQVWVRGTLLRLILEDGDILVQLEADPRNGWDAAGLIAVAASLR